LGCFVVHPSRRLDSTNGAVTIATMWTPEPLTDDDIREFAMISAAVAQDRIRRIFSEDLEIDPQLGTRPSTIMFHLDGVGGWIATELLRSGLVLVDNLMGRWPEPVRPAAAALWAVMPWSSDDLISKAPFTMSNLLEVLRTTPDLAQLITPPDLPSMRRPGDWRDWGARQEAIIVAAQS